MRKVYLMFISFLLFQVCFSQQIRNTSYTTQNGEKVLRLEFELPVDKKTAWKWFTENELLKKWIAPVVHFEMKNGGHMLTNYDKSKPLSDPSSIRLGLINYIPEEMYTLKVELNNHFDKSLQESDQNLQEIIQFVDAGNGKTKIISYMLGWGSGELWDKTYGFFLKGNEWTYQQLLKLF